MSNQGRIGRGEITEAAVLERFRWLNRRLGAPFTDWRLCPHQAGEGCRCRKPQPGMFLELAAAWDLDLERSIHVVIRRATVTRLPRPVSVSFTGPTTSSAGHHKRGDARRGPAANTLK